MKKILAVFLTILLFCATVSFALADSESESALVFKIGAVTAEAGKEIKVPIEITKNPGVAAFGIKYGFDAKVLEFERIELCATAMGNNELLHPSETRGIYTIGFLNNKDITYTGKIADIVFKVKPNAKSQTTEVSVGKIDGIIECAVNENFGYVSVKTENGNVTITGQATGYLQGDVNNDGYIDSTDMQRIYTHMDGSNPLVGAEAQARGDVNNDGYIDSTDMQRIYTHMDGSNPFPK